MHGRGQPVRLLGEPNVRDLTLSTGRIIEWWLDRQGRLGWRGSVADVLGPPPVAGDEVARLEEALAPVLHALRADAPWDDYELRHDLLDGARARQLIIRCRASLETGRSHAGIVMDVTERHHTQSHLNDLIDRYRLLVELSPDMIVVHEQGLVRYINPTGLAWMAATDEQEIVGRPISQFVAAESVGPLIQRLAALDHAGAVSSPTEMTLIRLDHRPLLVESQSVRTTWDGRPAFQVFLRDHSERRRAEAAVRYQANLVASVSDAVVATDLEGRITGWNPAATALYRHGSDEVLGRDARQVLGPAAVTPSGHVRAGEVHHLRADGTTVPVEVSVAPVRNDKGVIAGEVAVCADQTQHLLAAAERERAESRFSTVVTALTEGILVIEADGTISASNPAARSLLGSRSIDGADGIQVVSGHRLFDAAGGPMSERDHPIAVTLRTGIGCQDTVVGREDQGRVRWLSLNCEVLDRRPDGEVASVVCSFTDTTEQRAVAGRLAHAAAHDSLTGLPNRSRLLDVLDARLHSDASAIVLFVDLDRFKSINDAHGHFAGDQVLEEVARRVRTLVEPSGIVGRLAGDEFVAILPDAILPDALELSDRIRQRIRRPIRVGGQRDIVVTASIGIALSGPGQRAEAVLGDADMAMYQAKQRGRARVEVFDGEMRATTLRQLDLASRLREALASDVVGVQYQPIIDLVSMRTIGYEALARWIDPDLGPVAPSEFVSVAEDHGLIGDLGRLVLRKAAREAASWSESAGAGLPHIAVNLSASQLGGLHVVDEIARVLAEARLPADRLWLEVTESVLMENTPTSVGLLEDLRGLGVHLAIDDFGTGYSSFNYLRRFPVEVLKIDRSFIADLGASTEDDVIVDAIVHLGNNLGLSVTAEGVETIDQLQRLRELGCDAAQGYLMGRPITPPARRTWRGDGPKVAP